MTYLVKNGSMVIAHVNVLKRLGTEQFVNFLYKSYGPSPLYSLSIITYNNCLTFHDNDHKIDVYHIQNAHTHGHSIVHFNKNNINHTGDIYGSGRYFFIDQSSGGPIDGIILGIEKIISLTNDETKIIPSHGLLSNRAELQGYILMLKDIREQVRKMINNGSNR